MFSLIKKAFNSTCIYKLLFPALFALSKLGDKIEVKNILENGTFSINATDSEGNIC